jgi:L-ribulokinase
MMQLLADVTGLPVTIPDSSQIPARGAALCGAIAAGAQRGGYDDFETAVAELGPAMSLRYEPSPRHRATYDEVYSIFRSLHDALGREHVEWLHDLKQIRRATLATST